MRDGFFIYGRYDYGSSTDVDVSNTSSNEYIYGGHVGTAPTTGTGSRFHYHATKFLGCYHMSGANHYSELRCRDLAGWLRHRIQAAYPQLAGGVLVPMETVPILRRAMEEEADQVSDSCVIR